MHTIVHVESLKEAKNNKGSCRDYAKYLMKENKHFFSSDNDNITVEDAVFMIDNHARGRLLKTDAKWFAPVYSLSEEESRHIAYTMFGQNYYDFDELSEDQKEKFKAYVRDLGREFQNQMAANFHKENIGIVSGNDLVYVGVVECQRKYKGFEEEVKSGKRKEGELKKGFNTHIHVIQCRKANNKSQSKISPCANSRKQMTTKLGSVIGFDRNEFINRIEKSFDLKTKYYRSMEEEFEYKKARKKGQIIAVLSEKIEQKKDILENSKSEILIKEQKIRKKFYTKEYVDAISENTDIINYFFNLSEKGILEFDRKKSGYYYFKKHGQNTGSIAVSEKGWTDFSDSNKGGKIIKAIMHFEGKSWYDAISILEEEKGFYNYSVINNDALQRNESKKEENTNTQIKSVTKPHTSHVISYFFNRGISKEIILNNLVEIKYSRIINGVEKVFTSGGMKNNEGSYNVRGAKFKGIIGNKNSFTEVNGESDNKNIIVFEGFIDYLSYLEIYNKTNIEETVYILNSVNNSKKLIEHMTNKEFNKVLLLLNGDEKGNEATNLFLRKIPNSKDIRNDYNITNKYDLNDILLMRKDYNKIGRIYNGIR